MRDRTDVDSDARFGTFGGVFTPCTLTILGVIMFLRYGYVVGNAGFVWTIGILVTAKVITVLTTLSLSAIATNTQVRGGGAYFLISRSLGVEFGGAIGIVFFLAQAISVAMYVIGFTEALVAIGGDTVPFKLIATVTNIVVFACVYIGASWTIKVQYLILSLLAASLVSFFVGGVSAFQVEHLRANMGVHFVDGESLFTMFALFFPAVTGIMAGANMSGDLKNPGKSIPRGTLWAIGVTAVVYAVMAFFLAASRSADALVSDNLIAADIARWPTLISAGVFAATLSSALGSMMGAPRILQALSRDGIFPSLQMFGIGSGRNSEPRRATIVTFAISMVFILLGDLNSIAPLITMAFMITYGTINLATFYEGITKNPSYRPTFRYCHWLTSLLGTIGCGAVMLLMNWQWALISTLMMAMVYLFIYQKQLESQWGDVQSGLFFQRTRKNLIKLERKLYHPKNWRPIILAMSGGGWNRPNLATLGHWLTSTYGILNLGQVIQGNVEDRVDRIINQEEILERFIVERGIDAFPNIVAAPTVAEGIQYLMQCSGLGALRPNTLLLGWPSADRAEELLNTLRVISKLKRNVIITKLRENQDELRFVPPGPIDVWWRGRQNGELMLLLGHLLKQNPEWRHRTIRLMRVVSDEAARADVLNHLNTLAKESRIEVETHIVVSDDARQAIAGESHDAAITLLGFAMPDVGQEETFYGNMERLTEAIPRVVLVNSIGNMKLES